MSSAISPVGSMPATDPSLAGAATTAASSSDALGTESVFLQLLVSQIKNQDPLNPMDSMTFVTQLAQFSQLEATLGMRSDLKAVEQQATAGIPATQPSTVAPTT